MTPETATRLLPLLCCAVPFLTMYLQQVEESHPAFQVIGVVAMIAVAAGLGRVMQAMRKPEPKGDQDTVA